MNNKFLHICFIANIVLLACLLQISCLSESKNNKTNLQSLKAKEQRGSSVLNKGKEKPHTASLQPSQSRRKPILTRKQSKTVQHRFGDEKLPRLNTIQNLMYIETSWEEYAKIYSEAEWEPIRIEIEFLKLGSQIEEVPIKKLQALKMIMLQAKEVLEKLVKVKRLTMTWLPSPETLTNPEAYISSKIRKKGVDADLLIIVEFNDLLSPNTVAVSHTLEIEEKSGRPIIGIIKYNKNNFKIKKNMVKAGLDTAIHEFMHILAFNKQYYTKFIDPKTLKRIPMDKVIKEAIVDEKPTKLMILPRVVKAARKHFNCNNLEGLELENQELDGTEYSHWKQRFMHGDLMNGKPAAENAISEMTLAVLDDSGWYQTNPYTGGLFVYGQHRGCAFLEEKCIVNGVTKFKNEYCTGLFENNCDSSHRHKSYCPITDDRFEFPTKIRYFSNPMKGGTNMLSDFCPIPNKAGSADDDLVDSCIYGQKIENNNFSWYETIGPDSACFVTSVYDRRLEKYEYAESKDFSSACYEYRCNDKEGIVEIFLAEKKFKCPREGGPINVEFRDTVKGIVHCIDYNLVCNQTVKCNDIYECVVKESKRKNMKFNYISNTIGSGSNFEQ